MASECDIVNGLIEICRDAARGFRLAAGQAADPELKRLFLEASQQRELYAAELLPFAQGPATMAAGTAIGALHRRWMSLRDAVRQGDERVLIEEARRGEAAAASTYADAVTGFLPPNARRIVERQYSEILSVQQELDALSLPCA